MVDLFPPFRHGELVEYHRKYYQYHYHRHLTQIFQENSRLTDCYCRGDSCRLPDEDVRRN